MEPPQVVSLSFFDWASILLVAVVAWWALRSLVQLYGKTKTQLHESNQKMETERAERFIKQQESLEGSVRELIRVVSDLKSWVALEFVRRPDHERDIDQLREDIKAHADRFRDELDGHREQCPGRRTQ